MKATPPTPDRAVSAQYRTVSTMRPFVIITLTPRATPMIRATPSISRAPLTKVSAMLDSPIRSTNPMMMAKNRNRAENSPNHQSCGSQLGMVTPRSCQGMTLKIITRNASAKRKRIHLRRLVNSGRVSASSCFKKNFSFSSFFSKTRDLDGSALTLSA